MLKLIAIILVMIYVVIPLLRFLMKGYVITHVHKKMSEQSIDVDFVPSAAKSKPKPADDGDYVPYEEIKD